MGKRKKAFVTWQDGSTKAASDNYHELRESSYSDFMESKSPFGRNSDGEYNETTSANPDSLSDEDVAEANLLPEIEKHASGEEIILAESLAKLTGQQQKVWVLCMQMGKTESDAGRILKISQQAIHQHLQYAIQHVTDYCKANAYRLGASHDDL